MSMPDDKRKASPADRLHTILDADQTKKTPAVSRTYPKSTSAPNMHLPPPGKAEAKPVPTAAVIRAAVQPTVERSTGGNLLPAFWTIASIISLLFNVGMIIVVVMLLQGLGSLNASGLGPGVLGGLYSNFQLMDAAHIKTVIPVQTNIPLNLSIPVQTTTAISLAQAATIQGAHVRINTAALNIDAPATVTLPAGTSLNVVLGFSVPVQGQVPVSMTVPVDIAIHDTELHSPIQGLQDTIRPLYCMASPSAESVTGEPVCK